MGLLVYKLYCYLHFLAKVILGSYNRNKLYRMVSVDSLFQDKNLQSIKVHGLILNDQVIKNSKKIKKEFFFPLENIVEFNSNPNLADSFKKSKKIHYSFGADNEKDAMELWRSFIENSRIEKGYRNEGFHYAGFIGDQINSWCLPSWIWTNAALVRYYCSENKLEKAKELAKKFELVQHSNGGWIVRFDYTSNGASPILAPNDSAYIANNCFLELYKKTNEEKYLNIAIKCADWILSTCRSDGLVWTGYDIKNNKWLKSFTIVDTAFTAGFFAVLFDLTSDEKYILFLEKFCNSFINLFYDENKKGFATSIDLNNKKIGGQFTRGQAWVLEGLIPAYKTTKSKKIKKVISQTIENLKLNQLKNGGWPYNLSRPLLGEDCKGIPVIAKSILQWNILQSINLDYKVVEDSITWCMNHTSNSGKSKGGIFSFNAEGALVHTHYSSTAFVYSCVYACETLSILSKED